MKSMNIKNREEMVSDFLMCVKKYKASMEFSLGRRSKILKALYGVRLFGFRYIGYTAARLRLPVLFGDMKVQLFLGQKMVLPRNDIGAHVLGMYRIIPHASERRLTLWMIKNLKENDVFYDVGAHLGFYTALAQEILSKGEVHAFEANLKLHSYLQKNFSNSNVHTTRGAVADISGEVDFYDATDTQDSSESSRFNILGTYSEVTKVPAITLDSYIAMGHTPPTIIKFDIEGGEHDAIVGATNLIKAHKPAIVLEIWGGDKGAEYAVSAVRKLHELGYDAFCMNADGSVSDTVTPDPVFSLSSIDQSARDNFIFLPRK